MTSPDREPVVAPGATLAPGLLRSHLGEVAVFDVDSGLGEVISEGETYPFHCTAIAGGARVIDVGTKVVFSLVAFHGGELQASDLVASLAAASSRSSGSR